MRKEQQTLFDAVDDKHVNMTGDPWQRTPWTEGTTLWTNGIQPGDVVIVEEIHYDNTNGKRLPSKYYRAVCGEHRTVSGMMKTLKAEPDEEFPLMPPWQLGWLYLGGYVNQHYWRRKEDNHDTAGT